MIFTGFKRKSNQLFLNKRISYFLKKSAVNSSEKIKKVIVFLDDFSEKDNIQKDLMSLLKISKVDIELVVYQKNKSKGAELNAVITPKDFGWYGRLKSDKLKSILTKEYDLLINYSKVDNLYANLLLLQCKTSFKAGFAHLDNRFYDLIIDCEYSNLSLFNEELKKYLTILKKI